MVTKFFVIVIVAIAACLTSCMTQSENNQKEIDERLGNWANEVKLPQYCNLLETHINQNFVQHDTLLLGYVLGWNEKQVLEHTNSLIANGTISPLRKQIVQTFTIGNGFTAWDTISTWHGYDYGFQMDMNTRCYGFLNFAYDQGTLSYLSFFIIPQIDIDDIKSFLARKYGLPSYQTYVDKNAFDLKRMFIWLHGGKEIQLCEWLNHVHIQYSDVKKRLSEEKLLVQDVQRKKKEDSLEKNYLKKQAQTSHQVF